MDALLAIATRASTREFAPTPIDNLIIEQIINAARFAPTARNEQPWEFVAVTSQATRDKIAHLTDFGKFIAQAPVCVAVFCRDTKYYLEDGAAATTTLLIAANALDVQSCWVAGDKKSYCPAIAELLGVPAGHKLIALVALGKALKPAGGNPKRPLADLLHWDRFRQPADQSDNPPPAK